MAWFLYRITPATAWHRGKAQNLNQSFKMLCSTINPVKRSWTLPGNGLGVNPHIQDKNVLKQYCPDLIRTQRQWGSEQCNYIQGVGGRKYYMSSLLLKAMSMKRTRTFCGIIKNPSSLQTVLPQHVLPPSKINQWLTVLFLHVQQIITFLHLYGFHMKSFRNFLFL